MYNLHLGNVSDKRCRAVLIFWAYCGASVEETGNLYLHNQHNCLGFSVAQANAKKLASEAANTNASKNALEKATTGAREKAKERALALAKAEALKARDQALSAAKEETQDAAMSVAKTKAAAKATEIAQVGGVVIHNLHLGNVSEKSYRAVLIFWADCGANVEETGNFHLRNQH